MFGVPIWTKLFMKCKTAMSLQHWFQWTMACSLLICNWCWASTTDTPRDFPALLQRNRWQVRPSICQKCKCDYSKTVPCLMIVFFLQTFTGKRQVIPSTARCKTCSLHWQLEVGQSICVANSPYCQHRLMHSWRSLIKRSPIFTKDILSKIAWSGISATAMMTEWCIENGINKWKNIFSPQMRQKKNKKVYRIKYEYTDLGQ